MMNRIWNEESGVLTFEWILLITLLVIGIVGGLALIRDAYIIEAAETAEAMTALHQDYKINSSLVGVIATAGAGAAGPANYVASTAAGSSYTDVSGTVTVAVQ